MKNTNTCPKCGGTDILLIGGKEWPAGVNNNIPLFLSVAGVHRYLCCGCGYSEEWVDKADIPKLKNYKELRYDP